MNEIRSLEHFIAYNSIKDDYLSLSKLLITRDEYSDKPKGKEYQHYTNKCISLYDNIIENKSFLDVDSSSDYKKLNELKSTLCNS